MTISSSGPFLRSDTETDFPRPVCSVKRSLFAATVFVRSKPVNLVRILTHLFMCLTEKTKTDFVHIETILNWHVNLRKNYSKPLWFDETSSADIGWLNLNSSFRKRTLTSWGEKCFKISSVQIVHYEMGNPFRRANLLNRLPHSFSLRGRGSNIGYWPSSAQNLSRLSERP